jgi:cytochrome c peroxidase
MKRTCIIVVLLCLVGLFACKKETTAFFVGFKKPTNFPDPVYNLSNNAITADGFELGKSLFYDPILSVNNTISCGSCHIQSSAFTHHGHGVSHGIFDRMGTRNSPPIMNLAWGASFMWDGGIFDLDLQAIAPITNHVEMGETMVAVLQKLNASTKYQSMFKKAFGTEEITTSKFLKALSQFMLLCVSSNSKYDSIMRREGSVVFTTDEQEGYLLFKQKCNSCHAEPLFTDNTFRNNGIGVGHINDSGRYLITQNEVDLYKFKVPSLRNLAYTAPYMHDGRFFTLDAVFDHYTNGVQNTANLDQLLQENGNLGMAITADEKEKLKAFLNTLNDQRFLLDKRFSE